VKFTHSFTAHVCVPFIVIQVNSDEMDVVQRSCDVEGPYAGLATPLKMNVANVGNVGGQL
jgi:hypothetical protein